MGWAGTPDFFDANQLWNNGFDGFRRFVFHRGDNYGVWGPGLQQFCGWKSIGYCVGLRWRKDFY